MMCRLTSLSQPSCFKRPGPHRDLHSFPTRRSSDLVTRVLDEHAAFAGVEAGMTCGASGQHAIHHVNAKRDVIGDLFGAANAHEIARAVFRKEGGDFGGHGTSDFVRLAHGEAADGVTGEVEIEKLAGAFTAQVGESCALHDAKLPLLDWRAVAVSGFLKVRAGAASPSSGPLERSLRRFARRRSFDAFVEDHGDVGTQGELNFGDFLGREEMFGAVKMRTEAHAFVGNFAKFGKAEDLVAAGIRQNRAGPRHEPMQAAESANQFVTGTKIQMISVSENDFDAELFEHLLS